MLFPLFSDTHLFRRDRMWVWECGQTPPGLRASLLGPEQAPQRPTTRNSGTSAESEQTEVFVHSSALRDGIFGVFLAVARVRGEPVAPAGVDQVPHEPLKAACM